MDDYFAVHLTAALEHIAESISKVADAINNNAKQEQFPHIKNCGTCKFFRRKSLLEGLCLVNGEDHALPRRVSTEPCIQHKEYCE